MIIRDGFAANTTEGGEVIYSQTTVFRFSWETEKPARQTQNAMPKKAKRDGFQLRLF